MLVAASLLVVLIAVLHLYILVLEMFLWTTPRGMKAFGQSRAQAETTKVLAANQGLYNGFLAAGLVWSLCHPDKAFGWQIATFFLLCVLVAGIYGGLTANRKILLIQAFPAAVTLLLIWLGRAM